MGKCCQNERICLFGNLYEFPMLGKAYSIHIRAVLVCQRCIKLLYGEGVKDWVSSEADSEMKINMQDVLLQKTLGINTSGRK